MPDTEVVEKEEVVEATATMSPQEKAEAEAAKAAEEAKAKEGAETELDLDGLTKNEDGTFSLEMGNSTYHGKSIKEVVANARKGVAEKDKAYHELKAKQHIRTPERDEIEDELPEQPDESEFIRRVFQERQLDVKMLRWDNQQWKQHATEKELDPWEVKEEREKLSKAYNDAQRLCDNATISWLNRTSLHQDITPAIQDMVAESGLDAEELDLGGIYLRILKDPQYTNKQGVLNGTKIVLAMHKEILKHVKPTNKSAVARAAEEQKTKLEEKKKVLSAARTDKSTQVNEKAPLNIHDAAKRAMAMLKG